MESKTKNNGELKTKNVWGQPQRKMWGQPPRLSVERSSTRSKRRWGVDAGENVDAWENVKERRFSAALQSR